MKLIVKIMLIAALAYISGMYFPWWGVIITSAVVSLVMPTASFSAFVSGFIGVGLLWLVLAWKIEVESQGVLSHKIVQLFPVSDPIYLVIGTGLIGALAGGLGSVTGNSFLQIFIKKKKASFYS